MTYTTDNRGFTVVEALVTVVVASIFIAMFFQVYMIMESQRTTVVKQARANDAAYSNLSKVTARTGISCDTAGFDMVTAGYALVDAVELQRLFGTGSGQSLRAFPTNGCGGANFVNNPVRVESKVWYTVNGQRTEASHALLLR